MKEGIDQLLDPTNRKEVTVLFAAVAFHGLLSGGLPPGASYNDVVSKSFALAKCFLAAVEKEGT